MWTISINKVLRTEIISVRTHPEDKMDVVFLSNNGKHLQNVASSQKKSPKDRGSKVLWWEAGP